MPPQTQQNPGDKLGVIILTGGHSQRMGRPKWSLPFGSQTLLERTVETCQLISSEIVIAANPTQEFPDLGKRTTIVRDQHPDCGPLEGIRNGLALLQQRGLEWGFVTACDVPNLSPGIAPFLLEQSHGFEAVIPIREERIYGMTALYRCDLHPRIESLIKQRQLRVSHLARLFHCRLLLDEALRAVDQNLDSLGNLNYPEQYLAILQSLGLNPPAGFLDSLDR
ncbi:MAG: molybdenum cofactor guanylyltransferase [Mariniblastus sp.]|nr:molybdenum cofactor guanylyltransferase [Mariniblastus sp.]